METLELRFEALPEVGRYHLKAHRVAHENTEPLVEVLYLPLAHRLPGIRHDHGLDPRPALDLTHLLQLAVRLATVLGATVNSLANARTIGGLSPARNVPTLNACLIPSTSCTRSAPRSVNPRLATGPRLTPSYRSLYFCATS